MDTGLFERGEFGSRRSFVSKIPFFWNAMARTPASLRLETGAIRGGLPLNWIFSQRRKKADAIPKNQEWGRLPMKIGTEEHLTPKNNA